MTTEAKTVSGMKPHLLRDVCIIAIAMSLIMVGAYIFSTRWTTPSPVTAFSRHRSAFQLAVEGITTHHWPQRPDGQGFILSSELENDGVTYIRDEKGCIVFYFATFPPDANKLLVYSPGGYKQLPGMCNVEGNKDILTLIRLDSQWYYFVSE